MPVSPSVQYPHWKLIDEARGKGTHWQVLGYPRFVVLGNDVVDASRILAAGKDLRAAALAAATPHDEPVHPLHPIQHARVTLDNSAVYLEPGALQFMKGRIQIDVGVGAGGGGVGGLLRRAATSMASGESMVRPKYSGSGEIFLEPRRDHLMLVEVDDAQLMCDRGLFVACDASLTLDAHVMGVKGASQGGEGISMPVLRGNGVAMLASPVPLDRILRVQLQDEELKIDGPFAMMSVGKLQFSVERAAGFLGSAAGGEGFLNVYRGTGEVWLNLVEARCF